MLYIAKPLAVARSPHQHNTRFQWQVRTWDIFVCQPFVFMWSVKAGAGVRILHSQYTAWHKFAVNRGQNERRVYAAPLPVPPAGMIMRLRARRGGRLRQFRNAVRRLPHHDAGHVAERPAAKRSGTGTGTCPGVEYSPPATA